MNLFEKDNKKPTFNILGKQETHGGFGAGTINLNNISPIIIDIEQQTIEVDMGALHARSAVEKGIKFLPNQEEVPNGKPYWLVWVTIENRGKGPYYHGVTACYMTIDREIRRGYKSLPEHVNRMDKSLKGHIIIDHMDEPSKQLLKTFLKEHNEAMWERSSEELHNA